MSDSQTNSTNSVIACNPKAIASEKRNEHEALAQEIFSTDSILEIKELANGYGFHLPPEAAFLHKVIAFVENERRCCPFFTFTLVIGEGFWFELSGTPDVKVYIKAEIITALETQKFPTFADLEATYSAATGSES
jgi:hypothetical protein